MIDYPKTLEQAQAYKYNRWAGNPNGYRFDISRCAYEVHESGRGCMFYQCSRKPGKGAGNLYCGIHAKKVPQI